jgi:hypothetical protein
MACRYHLRVAQYASALLVVPCSMNATRRMPFWSQKTVAGLLIFIFILNTHKSCSSDAIDTELPWNKANGQLRSSKLQLVWSVDMLERYAQTVFTFWTTFVPFKCQLVKPSVFCVCDVTDTTCDLFPMHVRTKLHFFQVICFYKHARQDCINH